MNIVQIVQGFPPEDKAGVPQHVNRLAERLAVLNHRVAVVTGGSWKASRMTAHLCGLKILRMPAYPANWIPRVRRWKHPWFSYWVSRLGPGICHMLSAELLHGHTWEYGGKQAIALGARLNLPVIVTLHGLQLDGFSEMHKPQYWSELKKAAGLIVQKQRAVSLLRSWGYCQHNIRLCYGPVDTERFKPADKDASHVRTFRLIFVGRLDPIKSPLRAIEILERLHRQHPSVDLVVAGDGPLKPAMERAVKERKLHEAVKFVGWVDNLDEVYRTADLYLALSDKHNSSDLGLLEAMSCAVVPVATQSPGVEEAIRHGVDGLVCAYDADAMAEQISQLLANPDLRERMGKSCRQKILETASIEFVGNLHEFGYRAVLHDSTRVSQVGSRKGT